MEYLSFKFLIWAVSLGALSAVSLPLGSLAALRTNPRPQLISLLAAFGAGALVAALSVELVAPTVFALHEETGAAQHGEPFANFLALLIGAVAGGILFVSLDQLINAHGGFLRKTASSIAYFRKTDRERRKKLVENLSQWPLFQSVPSEHVDALVSMVQIKGFKGGEVLSKQGEDADELFFVMDGKVSANRDGSLAGHFGPGDVIGIIPFLTQTPNPGTALAESSVSMLILSKKNFDRLRSISPAFDKSCRNLTSARLEQLETLVSTRHEQAVDWARKATQALKTGTQIPTALQLRRAREEHGGAPLAIWLGILIDGIPESFVIGSGLLVLLQAKVALLDSLSIADVIPYTLIAGLFLSNFPEALASSASMRLQGRSSRNIFLMWFVLMVITAVGAGLGYLLADSLNPTWLIFAEGLAAGAMLTMIAATMIPEAVHMGNPSVVGLGTLAGFLAAISFKLLE